MHYRILADFILLLHFGLVGFVIFSVPIIWIGYFSGWKFVRNPAFRLTHLALMAVVIVQTYTGAMCPLTVWENNLRVRAGEGIRYEHSCITYWLDRLIFYDFSPRTFMVVYSLFFLLVVLSIVVVRPNWKRKRCSNKTFEME